MSGENTQIIFSSQNFSLDLVQDFSTLHCSILYKKNFKCLLFILVRVPCNPKEFNKDLDVIFQKILQLFLQALVKMHYYIMYFIYRLS